MLYKQIKGGSNMVGYVILAVVVALLVFVIMMRNNIVAKRNKVENADASIDVMLKKRFDVIPNLYDLVKQYMEHEKSLLESIVNIRNEVNKEKMTAKEKKVAEEKLNEFMKQLKVSVENYPDLKANQNFLQLQATLNEIEEQISAARRTYNANVTEYNTYIQIFPVNIVAAIFSAKKYDLFEISELERDSREWFK